ncbi:hypothetical protein CY34DRAFT_779154 [Suillus luteus UH-Slu-Lm8-n1]|uniref:14-3-3 domain-containing protein n=1 Tax=Suillus luteus UH-Slu-Lm8-n1 TaxID=930992 RepID=A0A0D0AQ60_9AGAM|nr:hypothetical protein CY34DRAFT_779154 [Suillus luteus UH-Slu-Lm8-n1]
MTSLNTWRYLLRAICPACIISREEYLLLAKVAEEAECYEDLVAQIKGLTQTYGALTIKERKLLSVAYKNITNPLRSSWRVVSLIRRQRVRIEKELTDACKDIVKLLNDSLLATAKVGEETVFYYKLKGDYYRYLAEFAQQQERSRCSDSSLAAYKFAYKHALAMLGPTHPTRLGLALNFAVYYHDVRKSPEKACHLGKHAFDEAVACLDDSSSMQVMRDSMTILQLLRDEER